LPENIIADFSDELLNNILREKVFEENKEIRTQIITSAIQNSLREAELPSSWTGYDNVDEGYFEKNENDNFNSTIDFDKDIDEILREIENDPELKIDEEEIERILKEIEQETEQENMSDVLLDNNTNITLDIE
jgi:hypothetical protein